MVTGKLRAGTSFAWVALSLITACYDAVSPCSAYSMGSEYYYMDVKKADHSRTYADSPLTDALTCSGNCLSIEELNAKDEYGLGGKDLLCSACHVLLARVQREIALTSPHGMGRVDDESIPEHMRHIEEAFNSTCATVQGYSTHRSVNRFMGRSGIHAVEKGHTRVAHPDGHQEFYLTHNGQIGFGDSRSDFAADAWLRRACRHFLLEWNGYIRERLVFHGKVEHFHDIFGRQGRLDTCRKMTGNEECDGSAADAERLGWNGVNWEGARARPHPGGAARDEL